MAINKNIPVTSREKYLAKIAGEEVNATNPINREDYFLNEISGNGGSGSGGGNSGVVGYTTEVDGLTEYLIGTNGNRVTAREVIDNAKNGKLLFVYSFRDYSDEETISVDYYLYSIIYTISFVEGFFRFSSGDPFMAPFVAQSYDDFVWRSNVT